MSMHALLLAIRNRIRAATPTGLAYANKDCDLAPPNGQPPPMMGQFYAAVHEGRIDADTSYSDFTEIYSVNVTVTVRGRGVPWDRLTEQLLYGTGSLDTRCRQIAALIHQDTYDNRIIRAANALSQLAAPGLGYDKQGFFVPLRFAGFDVGRSVGADWFHADPAEAEDNIGWAKTVRFVGAVRTQETLFAEAIGDIS